MYARPGLLRRSAPFLGVMVLAIAVLPLPPGGDGPTEIALASALTALIVLTVWLAPWHRLPQFAEVVPALSYLVVIALLGESQGGAMSGYSALAMLPVFWLALYGTRAQLAIGIAGLAAVFFVPLLILGAPEYPATEWRRAILWVCVSPILGFTVQALVAELRSRADETRLALANIEDVTASMRRIGASTDPDALRQAVCSSARTRRRGAGGARPPTPTRGPWPSARPPARSPARTSFSCWSRAPTTGSRSARPSACASRGPGKRPAPASRSCLARRYPSEKRRTGRGTGSARCTSSPCSATRPQWLCSCSAGQSR